MAKAATKPGDDEAPGMERGELKVMLKFARREPVRVAFAQDKEGKLVIVMDKRKPPRVLDRDLKEKLQDGRNHRFGTAEVTEDQPKLVKFMVNKASPHLTTSPLMAIIDANPVIKTKVKATLQAGYDQVQRLLDAHPTATQQK